jgi:hypothetical protein
MGDDVGLFRAGESPELANRRFAGAGLCPSGHSGSELAHRH